MTRKNLPPLRVKSVSVRQFRGIVRGSLNFIDHDGEPQSTFLLGDNGSGKSSYLEAISFGLTGRLPALVETNRSIQINPRNLLAETHEETTIEVQLSDGKTVSSSPTSKTRLAGFLRVPMLIKRDHLLAFGRGTDDQRGGLLRSMVSGQCLPKDSPGEEEQRIKRARDSARLEFEETFVQLRDLLGISGREKPSLSSPAVQVFRTAKRITRKQAGRKRRAGAYGAEIDTLIVLGERLQNATDEHERLTSEFSHARRARQRMRAISILISASNRLNKAFHAIAHEDSRRVVQRIELTEAAKGGSVALSVVLPNGSTIPAASVLSEASLDLTALLAMIAIAQDGAERGQERVLILDDVFHSVDDHLRDKLAVYLFAELLEWQLIIAFHGRAWFERFSDVAKQKNFPHVRRRIWRMPDGDVRVSEGYKSSREYLDNLIDTGAFTLVPAVCSRLLEELSEKLSIALKCLVRRTEGDKYTMSDL